MVIKEKENIARDTVDKKMCVRSDIWIEGNRTHQGADHADQCTRART